MRAELTAVHRMAPQLVDRRGLRALQQRRDLGLAARDQRNHLGLMAQREADRVVCGGVAGMQRRHHVGAAAGQRDLRDLARDERQAIEAAFLRQRLRALDQLGAHLDAHQRAVAGRPDRQVVEQEAEIGFAGAEIGQDRVRPLGQQCVERGPQQLHQMQHLLQLASRIEVEPAVARQHVQRLQQLHRTFPRATGPDLGQDLLRGDHVGTFAGRMLGHEGACGERRRGVQVHALPHVRVPAAAGGARR